jgi:hypothetical protein
VDMHATDLVRIKGITRVLLVYTCQQGVYPRDHVLPLRLPITIYRAEYLTPRSSCLPSVDFSLSAYSSPS